MLDLALVDKTALLLQMFHDVLICILGRGEWEGRGGRGRRCRHGWEEGCMHIHVYVRTSANSQFNLHNRTQHNTQHTKQHTTQHTTLTHCRFYQVLLNETYHLTPPSHMHLEVLPLPTQPHPQLLPSLHTLTCCPAKSVTSLVNLPILSTGHTTLSPFRNTS